MVNEVMLNLYYVYNECDSYGLKRKRSVIGSFFWKINFSYLKARTAKVNEIVFNAALINRKLKSKKTV